MIFSAPTIARHKNDPPPPDFSGGLFVVTFFPARTDEV